MFGLDNKSGINVMPPIAPADSQTPLWFTEGGAGLSATYPGQDWFNQIQAELLNILKAADITPQKGTLNQLSSAISKLASAYALSVVQATGQSLTSVMSQKAVTDALMNTVKDYLKLTGGTLTGQLNIEYVGGQGLTTKATAGTSIYHELYLLGKLVAWWGIVNSNELVLENRVTGQKLIIGPDGFKINDKNIATTDQLFGAGQTYKNLTGSRQNKVWYTNTDSKPRIVHVETNRTGTQYPFSIDIQIIHNGVQQRADYRWTTADEVICLTALIPPGARFSVNGGWGQPVEWEVLKYWLEYSL
ncbi:TPA: hypothetical protein ACYR80_000800 [Morganella morganii]|uniref:hypothetical protein n=1 Tax=Morganella morganii TaxID=582 RepID=UPI00104B3DED|nr:hypothetical protein [Morganella morganii]ELA9131510.1 hypothetical protein [Morganella morganii]MBA5852831.1 hypothetical protein [Morganella morganii]HBC7442436.1 hypothetical protein [Morganella morganii]HCU1241860.1 hypothetical protein [Morganella morganii]HDU8495974.1 hypothetical protein [Morganella morganii]